MEKTDETIAWLRRLFEDPTKTIVCHNAKFEMGMLRAEGIDVLEQYGKGATVHDTLILSKVLNSTEKIHSLEHCAKVRLGMATEDKTEIADWLKARNTRKLIRERGRALNFSDVPTEIVKRRVLWDVRATLGLYLEMKPTVDELCPQLYETERTLMYACVDMETRGVLVDVSRAEQLREDSLRDIQQLTQLISGYVGAVFNVKRRKKRDGTVVEKQIEAEFSPNSNTHLVQAFKNVGIKLQYKTKPKRNKKTGEVKGGGEWSFDEYAMMRYAHPLIAGIIRDSGEEAWSVARLVKTIEDTITKHKLPAHSGLPGYVLKWRQLLKMISTYYDHLIGDAVDIRTERGRKIGTLHCKFNQSEAMTGRFSSSEPNLQNMPRLLGPRECFITRKGRHNWHIDYSQVEMRMFVHFAEDEGMAAAIDADIHRYVATRIYRKAADEVTSEQRKRAKGTGFGILYGSGAETQAETLTKKGLPTTKLEATQVVAAFHREFSSIKRLTNDLKVQLTRQGYIENPFGRRYYIPLKFGYKALNYMCQGTSADIIKAAMAKIWRLLRVEGWKTRMIMTIHDEIVFEVVRSEAKKLIPRLVDIMENHKEFFVPIVVDCEVAAKRWSEKHSPPSLGFTFAA